MIRLPVDRLVRRLRMMKAAIPTENSPLQPEEVERCADIVEMAMAVPRVKETLCRARTVLQWHEVLSATERAEMLADINNALMMVNDAESLLGGSPPTT